MADRKGETTASYHGVWLIEREKSSAIGNYFNCGADVIMSNVLAFLEVTVL
jgi:hypothetical protein